MDFNWSADQQELYHKAIRFAQRELNSNLIEADRTAAFDRTAWQKCAGLGVFGLLIPAAYGGSDAGILTTVRVLEALGYSSADNGLLFSLNAHLWTCVLPILHLGSELQKQEFLPRLINGEWVGGNAMTEPHSGSDAYSLKATARLEADEYILNGSKTFVTNAPVADVLIIYARELSGAGEPISAFLVPTHSPGLTLGQPIEKMGHRTSPMAEVFLNDCRIPAHLRLGPPGGGMAAFGLSMEWERAFILASAVGSMQRLLETSLAYARERQQFGQSIGKFQLISTKLVHMKARLEQARLLLYHTAWLKSQGRAIHAEAALTKLAISEAWVQTAQDALQIHGGYGYTVEYQLERQLRDAIGSRIYSGTSEIQEQIIARFLGL